MYARSFAALAAHGEGRFAEALPLLRESLGPLFICAFSEGARDRMDMVFALEIGIVDSLRQTGSIRQERTMAENNQAVTEGWVPDNPERLRSYRRLAELQILVAGLLDPAVPAEALRCVELLNRAARQHARGTAQRSGRRQLSVCRALKRTQ